MKKVSGYFQEYSCSDLSKHELLRKLFIFFPFDASNMQHIRCVKTEASFLSCDLDTSKELVFLHEMQPGFS